MKKSLLDVAKTMKAYNCKQTKEALKKKFSDQDIELCVAFMKGELTMSQIARAKQFGFVNGYGGSYSNNFICRCLQYAQMNGKINIIEF